MRPSTEGVRYNHFRSYYNGIFINQGILLYFFLSFRSTISIDFKTALAEWIQKLRSGTEGVNIAIILGLSNGARYPGL